MFHLDITLRCKADIQGIRTFRGKGACRWTNPGRGKYKDDSQDSSRTGKADPGVYRKRTVVKKPTTGIPHDPAQGVQGIGVQYDRCPGTGVS